MPKKKHVYLAGAIEAAPDKGTRWRTVLTPQLEEMGYDIFNPCVETDGVILKELGWKKFNWEKIRKPKWRDKYLHIMRRIVEEDLKAVLASKFVIVYFDRYVQLGAGTYGEVTVAVNHDIPVYIVLAGDMEFENIPAWVVGCTTTIFDSFKELLDFLGDK